MDDEQHPLDKRVEALERRVQRLGDELLGLRLWAEALMYSHPAPDQLAVQIVKAREAALAAALPVAVSDASVDAIRKAADNALAIARRVAARPAER